MRITPLEIFRLLLWFAFGLGAWFLYTGLERIISFQPLVMIITGAGILLGLLFLFKFRQIPFF